MSTTSSTVRTIASELNIPNVDHVESWIRAKVDDVLLRTIETACKLSHGAKRGGKLKPRDITRALGSNAPIWLVGEDPKWVDAQHTSSHGNKKERIVFLADADVNVKTRASSDVLLPKYPIMPVFHTHWLAVEGIQPLIPENQHVASSSSSNKTAPLPPPPPLPPQPSPDLVPTHTPDEIVTAPLTKELRLFLEKIVAVLQQAENEQAGIDETRVRNVLTSLSNDPGLDQTVPHLVRYVFNRVQTNLHDMRALTTCVRLADALVRNPHLKNLDLYLHELIPAVMTCLVGKTNCAFATDDHWSLRDMAAHVMSSLCASFGDRYADIQPRICKMMLASLNMSQKPLTSQYGGIVGLAALGPLVVENVLLPHVLIGDYLKQVEAAANDGNATHTAAAVLRKYEATRVLNALRAALAPVAAAHSTNKLVESLGYEAGLVKEFEFRFV